MIKTFGSLIVEFGPLDYLLSLQIVKGGGQIVVLCADGLSDQFNQQIEFTFLFFGCLAGVPENQNQNILLAGLFVNDSGSYKPTLGLQQFLDHVFKGGVLKSLVDLGNRVVLAEPDKKVEIVFEDNQVALHILYSR